jgi:hypothetical protein
VALPGIAVLEVWFLQESEIIWTLVTLKLSPLIEPVS